MGNRGSKSVVHYSQIYATVKEQRVDGSWLLKNNLRCTLLAFERCYITSILSNRILTKATPEHFVLIRSYDKAGEMA